MGFRATMYGSQKAIYPWLKCHVRMKRKLKMTMFWEMTIDIKTTQPISDDLAYHCFLEHIVLSDFKNSAIFSNNQSTDNRAFRFFGDTRYNYNCSHGQKGPCTNHCTHYLTALALSMRYSAPIMTHSDSVFPMIALHKGRIIYCFLGYHGSKGKENIYETKRLSFDSIKHCFKVGFDIHDIYRLRVRVHVPLHQSAHINEQFEENQSIYQNIFNIQTVLLNPYYGNVKLVKPSVMM